MTTPPKCRVCLARLLPDGTCRYKCPPELKRSVVTAKVTAAKRRAVQAEREARAPRFSEEEVSRLGGVVATFDPIAARLRARSQRASRKRWR